MKWIISIGSFLAMQAYTQYAMWDCEIPVSRAEKMLFIPFLASLVWLVQCTLVMIMLAIVDDFPVKREKK